MDHALTVGNVLYTFGLIAVVIGVVGLAFAILSVIGRGFTR